MLTKFQNFSPNFWICHHIYEFWLNFWMLTKSSKFYQIQIFDKISSVIRKSIFIHAKLFLTISIHFPSFSFILSISSNLYLFSSIYIQDLIESPDLCAFAFTFIHFYPFSSIFTRLRPFLSTFINLYPFSSIFIHSVFIGFHPFYPRLSISFSFIRFHAFSSWRISMFDHHFWISSILSALSMFIYLFLTMYFHPLW